MPKAFTVAVDGPAAAGKGTLSRAVAEQFGFAHLDSGLLYREVGRRVLEGADPVEAARGLDPEALNPSRLRTAPIAEVSSRVAAMPGVRAALLEFQREFARRPGGAVLDGRDIGTVICPGAEAKLYVTASPEIRAERRRLELAERGEPMEFAEILADLRERDARDSGRADSPLRQADDAVVVDTTDMGVEDAIEAAIAEVARRI